MPRKIIQAIYYAFFPIFKLRSTTEQMPALVFICCPLSQDQPAYKGGGTERCGLAKCLCCRHFQLQVQSTRGN
jgi:hypothetical protein